MQQIRIKSIEPVHRFAHVIDLEAEMIDALLAAGAFGEQRHADDAVADMAAIGIGLVGFVDQIRGDLLHAEDRLIEFELRVVAFSVSGEMANLGDHGGAPFPDTKLVPSRLPAPRLSSLVPRGDLVLKTIDLGKGSLLDSARA